MNKTDLIIIFILLTVISYAIDLPYKKFTQLDRPADISALNQNFNAIEVYTQDKVFNVTTSTPTASDGVDGNIWLLDGSGTADRICFKLNNTWCFINRNQ
jgi:hypothetical protein